MPELTKLKKHNTIPFIKGTEWLRIGKSTIFNLSLNANVVTNDYIEDESPTDEITYYKPTLPLELAVNKGDPAFDLIYQMFIDTPTGTKAKKEVLIVFAGEISGGVAPDPQFKAWYDPTATVVLKDFDSVAEKITFDINFSGARTTVTTSVKDGKPSYSAEAVALSTREVKVSTIPGDSEDSTGTKKATK